VFGFWGWGPIPNPQSPIPNPQSPIPNYVFVKNLKINLYFIVKLKIKIYLIKNEENFI
jgi:hypothetical protein